MFYILRLFSFSFFFPRVFFFLPRNNRLDEGNKATHFLLRLTPSLTPIGTIRASRSSSSGTTKRPYYKLSRLAVLKEYRRYQFGRALVQRLHDWVAEDAIARVTQQDDHERQFEFAVPASHVVEIVSHSQIPVKGFYAK
jgi:GNAT superfamily N-acetyltransferase